METEKAISRNLIMWQTSSPEKESSGIFCRWILTDWSLRPHR